MKINLENISLQFESKPVLRDLTVEFTPNRINCLLGRSGAGKTSILRLIAGISRAQSGTIYFDGINGEDISIDQRHIGWVPQQQILFPGLNVKQNILYGLNVRRYSQAEKDSRLKEIIEIVGLENIIDRDIAKLSGGEKQRVALARAIAPHPHILLLDEPFSSLDAPERERLALAFRKIHFETGITTIHVTHSPREAEIISDKAFVLDEGKILQSGAMTELYSRPSTLEVAKILNLPNVYASGNEFDFTTPIMIPLEAVLIGSGNYNAKVISMTRDVIYMLSSEGTLIQTVNEYESLKLGQETNFEIKPELIVELKEANNQKDQ